MKTRKARKKMKGRKVHNKMKVHKARKNEGTQGT